MKHLAKAARQVAPQVVLRDSNSSVQTTICLHPVDAATKADQWPMAQIEAELSAVKRAIISPSWTSVQDTGSSH